MHEYPLVVGEPAWERWSEEVGLCDICLQLPDGQYCGDHDIDDDDVVRQLRLESA